MNPNIVTFEDLKIMYGYTKLESMEKFLIREKIPYKKGKGTITTTVQAVNANLGLEIKIQDTPQVKKMS